MEVKQYSKWLHHVFLMVRVFINFIMFDSVIRPKSLENQRVWKSAEVRASVAVDATGRPDGSPLLPKQAVPQYIPNNPKTGPIRPFLASTISAQVA